MVQSNSRFRNSQNLSAIKKTVQHSSRHFVRMISSCHILTSVHKRAYPAVFCSPAGLERFLWYLLDQSGSTVSTMAWFSEMILLMWRWRNSGLPGASDWPWKRGLYGLWGSSSPDSPPSSIGSSSSNSNPSGSPALIACVRERQCLYRLLLVLNAKPHGLQERNSLFREFGGETRSSSCRGQGWRFGGRWGRREKERVELDENQQRNLPSMNF